MPLLNLRPRLPLLAASLLFLWMHAAAQVSGAPGAAKPATDYSGMYSFLREGEFVQVTVEQAGRVTGFISRYGDTEGDRGEFLDHFFTQGKLEGTRLTFTTKTVHGVFYEFRGTIDRGQANNPGEEAYYVLRGTLITNTTDDAKKTSSHSQDVAFKSFPQDLGAGSSQKK